MTCQRVTEYASGREARDDLGRVLVLLEARLSALILVAEGSTGLGCWMPLTTADADGGAL